MDDLFAGVRLAVDAVSRSALTADEKVLCFKGLVVLGKALADPTLAPQLRDVLARFEVEERERSAADKGNPSKGDHNG